MKDNDKDIELITRYFDLNLSEEELNSFEKRANEDADFLQKIKTYQESIAIVNDTFKDTDQEQRTKQWRSSISSEKDVHQNPVLWKWIASIAAGILVLISTWYFVNAAKSPNLDQLTQQAWNKNVGFDYFKMREGNENTTRKTILNAFEKYEKGSFQDALALLKTINSSSLYYEDKLLIEALSLYRIGDLDNALKTLETLSNYPSGKMAKEALWYQGLIYLDKKDTRTAKKFLEIPEDGTSAIKLKE